jgi:6-phosphogluconate dehydrogenase
MIGGETVVYKKMLPLLRALAPDGGYLYCGPSGAGHFVKMVHNGIEYGMMSSLGEGFAVLGQSPYAAGLDLAQVARLWNRGSIIRSWLLELVGNVFGKDRDLIGVKGVVEDSGEGRWFVQQAIQTDVPATLIASALFQRFRSRQADPFSDRLLAALRHEFGGHDMRKAGRKAGRAGVNRGGD